MNESADDWGLVFDTLLLIAFLQSYAETPEAAASRKRRKNGAHGGRKETDFCSYGERKDNDEH